MFKIQFCGTGGAIPLPNRRLSSFNLNYQGRNILFDCGEACQISLRELHSGFKNFDIIFISHRHGDHLFGLPGLLLTIGNSERTDPLLIIAPFNMSNDIKILLSLCQLPFDIYLFTTRAKLSQKLYFNINSNGCKLLAITNPIEETLNINTDSSKSYKDNCQCHSSPCDGEVKNKSAFFRMEKVYEAKPKYTFNYNSTSDEMCEETSSETRQSFYLPKENTVVTYDAMSSTNCEVHTSCDFANFQLLESAEEIELWEKDYVFDEESAKPLATALAKANLIITPSLQNHRCPCLACRLDFLRRPKFIVSLAEELKIPKVFWSRLQRGEIVESYTPNDVMRALRPGFSIGYVTDSRPVTSNKELFKKIDLLVSEATFASDDDLAKAKFHKHMTYREAAIQAKEAQVKQLILTHFSAAIKEPEEFITNAQEEHSNCSCAHDLMELTFKFPE